MFYVDGDFFDDIGLIFLKIIDMKDFMKGKYMVIYEDLSNG